MSEEDYIPATDPSGARPGGDRVRFERDARGNEQSIFGGSSADIEKSMLEDTYNNTRIIGKKIAGVRTEKLALGVGEMNEVLLRFTDGTWAKITGDNLKVEVPN